MQKIQTSTATKLFRETDALHLAKKFLPTNTNEPLRILSFGCSYGDELATLKCLYPEAQVFGCDIDNAALQVAQQNVGHLAEVFKSNENEINQRGPFDLICAFSSLCVNPLPPLPQFLQQFPFTLFEEMIALLDNNLSPGGLLTLKNTSYPFVSTQVSKRYTPIRSRSISQNGFIPTINPNGQVALHSLLPTPAPTTVFAVGDTTGLDDWSFIDCVFKKTNGTSMSGKVINETQSKRPIQARKSVGQWSRCNLDDFNQRADDNLIQIAIDYQCFTDPDTPDMAYLESTIRRRSIAETSDLVFHSGQWLAL